MSSPAPTSGTVNVHLDGQWVQVPSGINVIEAARLHGKFIPHYCYHPKLQVVGNCRMCLFEMGMPKTGPDRKPILGADGRPDINWMPRPQIACATTVSEGMGIRTDSPLADECRKGVMEFLLINHPLDCPICDQAGECKLQEFSVEYGTSESRFVEKKVTKPKQVDLGERIMLDDERCILCSRCIRFTRDVVGDDCLGFVSRGSLSYLTAHPGKRFDNNYSLNTVDLCPVGALTSKDFRFQMRVWFLKETKSLCTSCGTGCNTTIGSREGVVYRQTPRENEAVNQCWMCDRGRLNFHYLQDEKRITQVMARAGSARFSLDWAEATTQAASRMKGHKPERVALIASARMTNEELYLFRQIRSALGGDAVLADIVARPQTPDKLLVCDDGNPNTQGARLMGLASPSGENLQRIVEGIRQGLFDLVLVWHEDLTTLGLTKEDLGGIPCLIASAMLPSGTTEAATLMLPGTGFAEKSGTMINVKGRIQRLNQAVPPPAGVTHDLETLSVLLRGLDQEIPFGAEAVFKTMAADLPALRGLTLAKIGDQGIPLDVASF
jgi:NADH-quinone oxidoreductase subunit G